MLRGSGNIKRLIVPNEVASGRAIDAQRNPSALHRLASSTRSGGISPNEASGKQAQNGYAFVLKVGLRDSSALRDSVAFRLTMTRGAARRFVFRTEYSYSTLEGMAD